MTVFDIEVAPNKAMVGFMDVATGKVKQFEHDEGKKIAKYIKKRTLVGFNSFNYDDIILEYMMHGSTAKEIYKTSCDLVEGEGRRWDYRPDLKSVDLMEVAPGQASLKLYGARLFAKKLQDLPYNPHAKHSKKMWKNVKEYNVNDLELTKLLYETLKPQLQIREDIGKDYNINVLSRSDAQVAEDVFKAVLKLQRKPDIQRPKFVTYKAPDYVQFKSNHLNDLVKKINKTKFAVSPSGSIVTPDWIKEDDKVIIAGVPYTIGIGGLHSNEKSVAYVGKIANADIGSMYPSLIINSGKYPPHLGEKWLRIYKEYRDKRMEIKHTDKTLSAMLKIFLNGSFGKLGSRYSILYAPELLLDTTLTGQLTLLMTIEALTDAGITVVSGNTDGVEYLYKNKKQLKKAQKIIDEIGEVSNLTWEHATYKALYSRDVNSYIAVYDGYTKRKGFYAEPGLQKNPEYPIVQDAIAEFLLNGTSIKKTIRACKDVTQFCISRQVTGGALWSPKTYPNTEEYDKFIKEFEAGTRKDNKALRKRNETYQREFVLAEADQWYIGKVVRFYYAKDGRPMYYKKSGNKVPKTGDFNGVKPMMELEKKVPKDIDYKAYYALADKHLKELGYGKI